MAANTWNRSTDSYPKDPLRFSSVLFHCVRRRQHPSSCTAIGTTQLTEAKKDSPIEPGLGIFSLVLVQVQERLVSDQLNM